MSKYIDKYKNRVLSGGKNVGDALSRDTVEFINSTFTNATTYRLLHIESSKYTDVKTMDSRVIEVERLGTLRELILRPQDNLEVGMYVLIDDDWYLIFDKYGGTGSSSIKLTSIKINNNIKWIDRNGIEKSYKCVASNTDLGSKGKLSRNIIEYNKYDVKLPSGQLLVSVELNDDTALIELNHRFIFGRNVYEVIGLDDTTNAFNGYGIIQFTVKLVPKNIKDDFDNQIAFNSYTDEESDDIDSKKDNAVKDGLIDDEEDVGGRLW